MRTHRGVAGALLVAVLVAGCSSDGGQAAAPAVEMGEGGSESVSYAEDSAGGDGEAPDGADRLDAEPQYVITEGYMTVVVDEPTDAAPLVTDIARKAGGYVESRSERAPSGERAGSATLVLRIPAEVLDATLDEIEALGELASRDTSATDVSLQVTDLDARIDSLETSTDRLLEMLAAAQRTEDLIQIEETLQYRQSELESLRAQRTVLGNRVALATIEVELTTDPPPPTVGPGGFLPGLQTGWQSLVDTLRGASVVVGILIPWIAFFGILAAVLVPLARRRRRARASAAPAGFGPPAATTPVAPVPPAAPTTPTAEPGPERPATPPAQGKESPVSKQARGKA